jgi:epoxyqueuosine reductase
MEHLKDQRSHFIKETAKKLGFDFCGISKAEFLEKEAKDLDSWLSKNYHGLLHPGTKSIISVILNYFPKEDLNQENALKVAKYAFGEDYHLVIKEKLSDFLDSIITQYGEVSARIFVDSAPVMDKVWAKKAGLGWVGKNTNLINREMGSFFFIAEILIDLELTYDGPIKDYCGTCTACLDACPTDALFEPYKIDASKCISYFTIELKDEIPSEVKGKFENWVFGCDICQDVCPWNSFSKPHKTAEFDPLAALKNRNDWKDISEEVFKEIFRRSAIKRSKIEGLKRNIKFLEN